MMRRHEETKMTMMTKVTMMAMMTKMTIMAMMTMMTIMAMMAMIAMITYPIAVDSPLRSVSPPANEKQLKYRIVTKILLVSF